MKYILKTKKKWRNLQILRLFRYINAERSHWQQNCTTKNTKGSPWARKKVIPIGYMDECKGMKSTRNDKAVGT